MIELLLFDVISLGGTRDYTKPHNVEEMMLKGEERTKCMVRMDA